MEQPKKKRDLRSYKKAWENKRSWVKGVDDPHKAFCTVCCREITVGYGGFRDIIRHERAAVHINARLSKEASDLGTFSVTSTANNIDADCTVVSYGNDQDSRADKKMHLLGRTREETTSKNVLGQSTMGEMVSDLPTDLGSSLRMWVPPLRLLSASIWQVVQQRQVESYNRVEEFVSVVLELIPDLLSPEERIELLLGLRTKFALDSCHHQPSRTFQMMSSHLERVSRIADIASSHGDVSQTVDAAVRNFKELIQSLADSPEYRTQYFQDIYPFHYGPSYDAALQLLVWKFLSRLEMLLPVPSFHQAASLFDEDPLLLEEFLQMGDDPQPIQELLLHNKHFTHLLSGSSPATMSNTILPTLSDSPILQAVLGASQQSDKCLSAPHEPQSSQNKADMYGDLNDEDCSGEVDKEDPQQDWQVVIIGTSQHDQQCEQTCSGDDVEDQGGPQRDSDEGQSDTSQHDQQSDSEQSSQTCNGMPSPYIVVDWRGDDDDDDDDDGDPQRDSDEGQSDTSQHDQQGLSSSLMVDINEDSYGDMYEGHSDEKQSHTIVQQTIDQQRLFQQSSQMTFCQQEDETTSGCINACERTPKIKTEEEDPPSIAVLSALSDNEDITSSMFSKHDKVSLKADLVKNMNTRTKRNHVAAMMAADGPPHPCSICGKAFSRKFDLKSHQTIHTGEKPHVCPYCGKRCRLKRMLKSHLKIHEGEWPFECSSCGKKFMQHTELEQHLKRHNGCRINCERMTNYENEGKDPPTTKEENRVSSTQKGNLQKGVVLTDNKDVGTSLLIEDDKESLKIDPAKNMDTRTKQNHVAAKMAANRPRHVCSICGKIFIRKSYLNNHHSIHTGEKPHVCAYCGKRFRLKDLLKSHINTHKGEWPFECSSCGKKFIQHSELVQHLKEHTGCRSYCEMITNNNNEGKDPLSTKEDNRESSNLKGNLHKGVVLSDNKDVGTSSLIEHDKESVKADPAKSMNTRTKRKHLAGASRPRHVCSICGKIFIRKSYLNNHHSIHTGEKPHVCSYCGKRFRLKRMLKSHINTHKGERTFEGSSCGEKFSHHSELAHHQKQHAGCEMKTNNKNGGKDPPSTKEENRVSSTQKGNLHKGGVLSDYKDVGISSLIEHDNESLKTDPAKNMDTRPKLNHLAAKMDDNQPRHPCAICGKTFTRKSYLTAHHTIHTGEKPHACPCCGNRFRLKRMLKSHMNTHKGEWPFECSSCGKKFIQHSEWAHHLKLHTGEIPFECSSCGKKFKKHSRLVWHLARYRNTDCKIECERMVKHRSEEKDPSPTQDSQISTLQATLHKVAAYSNKKAAKRSPKYPCFDCDKVFSNAFYLKTHRTIHTGERPHVCSYCGKTFRLKGILTGHLRTHTGQRPYECSVCGKRFTQPSILAAHKLIHTGEKPFLCSICGKSFPTSARLSHHAQTHTEERPFRCEFCDKPFRRSYDLATHRRVHTKEKPFPCTLCTKRFTLPDHVRRHMRTHTGEKPYECLQCGKRFAERGNLKVHQRVHR